jgi:hypothetical protein
VTGTASVAVGRGIQGSLLTLRCKFVSGSFQKRTADHRARYRKQGDSYALRWAFVKELTVELSGGDLGGSPLERFVRLRRYDKGLISFRLVPHYPPRRVNKHRNHERG